MSTAKGLLSRTEMSKRMDGINPLTFLYIISEKNSML
jgi:hypothetical protein